LPKARPHKRVHDPERSIRRLLIVVAAGVALYLFGYNEVRAPLRPPLAPPQGFLVAPGATTDSIGRQLRDLGVVSHPVVFRLWVQIRRAEGKLKAGEYAIDGPMSLEQIVDMLVRGDTVRRDVRSYRQLLEGRLDAQWVETFGVVHDATREASGQVTLEVAGDEGHFQVTLPALAGTSRGCPCPRLMERYRLRGDIGEDWRTWVR